MKTKINIDFESLKNEFDEMNDLRKERNEFLELRKIGENISLRILESGKEVAVLKDTFDNLFSYRDNYKCKVDFDKKELHIFTSTALHTHSEYSILDGANRLKDLTKKYEYSGALTDHGVMYGFIDFYKKMKAVYKKPIIGFEAYTESITGDENKYHLIILAKNDIGLKNAMKLCTKGNLHPSSGKTPRPIISYDELKEYHEGLIILSACIAGEVPNMIVEKNEEKLKEVISFYKNTFGEDYYFEIQRHITRELVEKTITEEKLVVSVEDAVEDYHNLSKEVFVYKYSRHLYRTIYLYVKEPMVNERMLELSKEYGIKVVATTDAHYLNKTDSYMHEALLCNQTKKTLSDPDRFRFAGTNYHVHTVEEMETLYYDMPEVLINTLEIEDKCNVEIEFGNYKLPKYPIPKGYTDKTYLEKLVWDGFEERFGKTVEEFQIKVGESDREKAEEEFQERKDRIKFELDTVFRMGYQGYFFIVWSYVKYARENGIFVGPGRGCVNDETLLYTETGLKKICDVEVGESVYTHDGSLKTVLDTHKYPTEKGEKLIKPRVFYGDEFGNAYTANHKILAVRNLNTEEEIIYADEDDVKFEWVAAKDLKIGDYLVMPHFKEVDNHNRILRLFKRNNIILNHTFSSTDFEEISNTKLDLVSMNIPNDLTFKDGIWTITIPENCLNLCTDYTLKRIYKIEEESADYVYDITVENNHSYVTSCFAAHNSGAGSLVLYCLHITEQLDPIKYDLLFERFLNPDRISMPDIDLDFEFEYREQVINACRKRYGEECVSRIITFGTMAAKGAIRDMARVLGYQPSFADMIAKLIPAEPKMTIQKSFKQADFEELYNTNIDAKKVIDLAIQVEGLIKNTSQHACGVIISSEDISNFCPMTLSTDKETGITALTTQITMGECEEIGLLKFDFLGLRTESVIKETLSDIKKIYGKEIGNYDIPINDVNVYANLLAKGKTEGVFQLESDGMTSVITQMYQDVPSRMKGMNERELNDFGYELYERNVAAVSLYRPGPMDEIPKYINGMLDPTKVVYDTPELESILNTTYGVLVYQEQVILAVKKLAGFSQGQADEIRKAMGKKKQEILNIYKPYFINGSGRNIDPHTNKPYGIKGCVANGIDADVAEKIWNKMESFGKYAFNKSHGAAYAVICMQTAWLAYYYPVLFMKANLNVYITNPDKLKMYLAFCSKNEIKMLEPSVNESEEYFSLNSDGTAIRFGLKGVKGLDKISKSIITERKKGKFTSLENFISRMIKNQKISSGNLEALIYVGALDEFEGTRKEKIEALDKILAIQKVVSISNQGTIFDLANEFHITNMDALYKVEFANKEEYEKNEILEKENEYSGFYISGHPLDDYKMILDYSDLVHISSLVADENAEIYVNSFLRVGGMITNLVKRNTKSGGFLYTFTLKDITGDLNCVCFESKYTKNLGKIEENAKVIISGKFEINDFGPQLLVDVVKDLGQISQNVVAINLISDSDLHTARNQYIELSNLVPTDIGNIKLNFLRDGIIQPGIHNGKYSMQFFANLQNIFGENSCKLVYKF